MVENIGIALVSLCTAEDIDIYLSEAECETFPYAVYDADYTPSYDKDGIYKIVGDITVNAYSKDYSEAQELAESINTLILDNFASDGYTVRVLSQLKKDCQQETWSVTYEYRITQYRTNQ